MGRQKKGEREERWKYREERVYIYHLSLHLPPIYSPLIPILSSCPSSLPEDGSYQNHRERHIGMVASAYNLSIRKIRPMQEVCFKLSLTWVTQRVPGESGINHKKRKETSRPSTLNFLL